jgi:hypothetical protein
MNAKVVENSPDQKQETMIQSAYYNLEGVVENLVENWWKTFSHIAIVRFNQHFALVNF